MVAYDYSAEPNNPWDMATWNPRAQIDFTRRMRSAWNFNGTAQKRIEQRIAQSDTKGVPPMPVKKQPPFQVIVQRRTFVTQTPAPPATPPVVGFGQIGLIETAQRFTLAVAPFSVILPGTSPSEAHCDGTPTYDAVLYLVDAANTVLCTVTFASGSNTGTFSWGSSVTINAGDILYVVGPAIADPSLSGVNIAFVGTLPS